MTEHWTSGAAACRVQTQTQLARNDGEEEGEEERDCRDKRADQSIKSGVLRGFWCLDRRQLMSR